MIAGPVTLEDVAARLDTLLERTAAADRRFLTIESAAAYSDLSPASIRRLISAGKLTALRPCRGRVQIDRVQLDALILSSTAQPRRGRGLR